MKARIDRDGCIACGLCFTDCPEVFRLADDGLAEVIAEEVPAEYEQGARDAADGCPVAVIIIDED